jgi:hypothetical protein
MKRFWGNLWRYLAALSASEGGEMLSPRRKASLLVDEDRKGRLRRQ